MFDLSQQNEVKIKDKQSFSPFPEFSPFILPGPRIDSLPKLRASRQAVSAPRVDFIPAPAPYQAPEDNPIVGENLFLTNTFPIRQNDNPFVKGLKGIGNFGIVHYPLPENY